LMRKCVICAAKFKPDKRRTKTCSSACAQENKRRVKNAATVRAQKENRLERLEYARGWRAKNPGQHRRSHLMRSYGITVEQFDEMRRKQKFKCAICKKRKPLVVDHCHRFKKVRGLLCSTCNAGIGHLKDCTKTMRSAIKYLEK